ncbi:DUF6174 domain-containing protein [Streptomyces sp. NBC_00286]|uniref:DUF6174 domain-containing protein n=1 Tax=Streptomyces sp. NBC_00286 TaxID=2975701 RepID=UPI002E2BDCC1|nr:DUF6174 domain-containing protein [Streptomyces sp. NBC_00286]
MTAVRFGPRFMSAAVLIGALMCATAACGTEASTSSGSAEGTEPKSAIGQSEITWEEPASYAYTLTSSEQALHGTFRVTVRDGKAAKAVGLDDNGRQALQQVPGQVPTIGDLLERLEQARRDKVNTAEAEYAGDGHPVRITLDGNENTIDDEALYVISAYEPAMS